MRELITAKDIEIQTKIIGKRIADDHRGDKTPVIMVGLLNGCFAFYSDLVRAAPIVVEYLEVKHPASISIVSLITRETSPIPKQKSYHAFTIDNEWIVGMGCDDEKGFNRNLNSIWAL